MAEEKEHSKFMVAVDGSDHSRRAFDVAARLRRPGDHVLVSHVFDNTKTYLPPKFKPEFIKSHYETACTTRFPHDQYKILLKEKKPQDKARVEIVNIANREKPTFLVVGSVGRKGPKQDPTILGATTDFSLRKAACSSVVVKASRDVPGDKCTYFIGVDGASVRGVEAVRLVAQPDDTVVVGHVLASASSDAVDKSEDVREKFSKLLKSFKCKTDLVTMNGPKVGKLLCDKAEELEADFLVVGADGMEHFLKNKSFLGSVSDFCVRTAKCHVIVCAETG